MAGTFVGRFSVTLLIASIACGANGQTSEERARDEDHRRVEQVLDLLEGDEWTPEMRDLGTKAAKAQIEFWTFCLAQERKALAKSRAEIADVVTAIMAGCAYDERLTHRAIAASFRGSAEPSERRAEADRLVARMRESNRQWLTRELVKSRLP